MKSKRVLIPIILVAVLLAAGLLYVSGWYGDEANNRIRFSGNMELTEIKVALKVSGRIDHLPAREGDFVRKGAILAQLDRAQLLRQRERLQAARAGAEARLRQVETAIDLQAETLEGQIEQRRAEVRNAEAVLAEVLAGSRKQDVEQARAALTRARAEYASASSDWERARVLFKDEDISVSAHDQAKARFEAAAAQVRQAEERLSLVEEGARPETIEAAKAQLSRAQAGLRLAESGRLELKRTRQEREVRGAEIDQITAELAVNESQLNDAVAVSPIDGVVLVKSSEPGEVVPAGATILTLGDIDHPWLRGYIQETDLGRVKLGMPVKVVTDSFPDKIYQGTVTFIASEAEFTPKQIQTAEERVKLVYRIKVDIENPHRELKSNMPADAEIVLER